MGKNCKIPPRTPTQKTWGKITEELQTLSRTTFPLSWDNISVFLGSERGGEFCSFSAFFGVFEYFCQAFRVVKRKQLATLNCKLGRCPSTVWPVFPVLVFQLSKQPNRTATTSSTALGTPPNRTRTKRFPSEELVGWVPNYQKPGNHPNFRKNALGAKRPFSELSESSGVFSEQLSELEIAFSEYEIPFSEWPLTT